MLLSGKFCYNLNRVDIVMETLKVRLWWTMRWKDSYLMRHHSPKREEQVAVQALDNVEIWVILVSKGITWLLKAPAALQSSMKAKDNVITQSAQFHCERANDWWGGPAHTLMCEVKRLSTANPSQEALSPNYVLLMKAKTLLPPGLFDKNDIYNLDVACSKSST